MSEKAQILISAVDDTKQAFASVKESMRGVTEAVVSVRAAMAGFGIVFSGLAFAHAIKGAIDTADELNKLSQKIGVSVENLSTLKHAVELSDLSMDGFTTGIKKLSSAVFAASTHVKEQENLFKALHIAYTGAGGSMRDTDAVLLDVADRFSKMENGVAKTALAVKLFGKSGIEMIPFLNQGAGAIKQLQDEARRLNLEISGETAAAAEQFNDNLKTLKEASGALSREMAKTLLPGLTEITNAMREAAKEGGPLYAVFIGLGGTLDALLRKMGLIRDQPINSQFDKASASADELLGRINKLREGLKGFGGAAAILGESDEIRRAKTELASLEAILKAKQSAVSAPIKRKGLGDVDLSQLDARKDESAKKGEEFLKSLREQIEQVGKGEFAMLHLKASLLGVSDAADPLIKKLKRTKEAHQDLIDRQDAAARSVDNLIEQMNRADFYDPQKIDGFTKGIKDNIDEVKFQTSIINDSALAQQLATEARKIDLEVQKVSKDLTRENTDELKKQAEVLKGELSDALKQANAESRTFNKGMSDAFKRYIDDAENVAKRTDDAFTKAFQGAEDALTQFVTTGKLGFGDFLKSIATDLARSNIKDLMANLFKTNMPSGGGSSGGSLLGSLGSIASSYFGGGGSGLDWMSSIDTMYGFASGGKFKVGGSGGTDSQLVAFRASPDETVHVTRPDQSTGSNVGVNITINNDGGSIQKNEAGKLGRDMEAAILGVVIKHRRPGGVLA